MAHRSNGKFAPDFMIMMRRKEEDNRSVFEKKRKDDSAIENYATWEHKTSGRITKNAVAGTINTIKRDLEDHLNARRCVPRSSTDLSAYRVHLDALCQSPQISRDRLLHSVQLPLTHARRARLAAMLNEESEDYTRELQALEETPEMRRDRLKSRARELVRRREKEKRDFANLMRERQVSLRPGRPQQPPPWTPSSVASNNHPPSS